MTAGCDKFIHYWRELFLVLILAVVIMLYGSVAKAQIPIAKPDRAVAGLQSGIPDAATSDTTTAAIPIEKPSQSVAKEENNTGEIGPQNSGLGSSNSDEPINIASDMLTVMQDKNSALWEGNVDAIQGDMRLKSDKLEVFYENKDEGDGSGVGAVTHMHATGHVVFITPTEMAQGDRGVYYVRNRTIQLYGNVVVNQGNNVLRGSQLDIDLNTNRSVLKSDAKGQRVVGRFVPDSDEDASEPAPVN